MSLDKSIKTTLHRLKYLECQFYTKIDQQLKDAFLKNFDEYKKSMHDIGGYNFANKLIQLTGLYKADEDKNFVYDYYADQMMSNKIFQYNNFHDIMDFLTYYKLQKKLIFGDPLDKFERSIQKSLFLYKNKEIDSFADVQSDIQINRQFVWTQDYDKFKYPFKNCNIFLENFNIKPDDNLLLRSHMDGRIFITNKEQGYEIEFCHYNKNDVNTINVLKSIFMRRATKYDCIIFDREPFTFDGATYSYLNNSNLQQFAQILQQDKYQFSDSQGLVYLDKQVRPIETFLTFITLNNNFDVYFAKVDNNLQYESEEKFMQLLKNLLDINTYELNSKLDLCSFDKTNVSACTNLQVIRDANFQQLIYSDFYKHATENSYVYNCQRILDQINKRSNGKNKKFIICVEKEEYHFYFQYIYKLLSNQQNQLIEQKYQTDNFLQNLTFEKVLEKGIKTEFINIIDQGYTDCNICRYVSDIKKIKNQLI